MKKIKLDIFERLGVSAIFNEIYSAGGLDLIGLRVVQKIIDKIMLSEEERKAMDYKQVEENGKQVVKWNPTKVKEKEVEFSEDEVKMIEESIKTKNSKKGFNPADKFIFGLMDKFGIKL